MKAQNPQKSYKFQKSEKPKISQVRLYFVFIVILSCAFCYSFIACGAERTFEREDLSFAEVKSPGHLPKIVEFYNDQGHILDTGIAWDNLSKAQAVTIGYHCFTASTEDDVVGALEWSSYPRLFDGTPRVDLHITAKGDSQGKTVVESLFALGAGLAKQYQSTLEPDMGSKIRMSINVQADAGGNAIGGSKVVDKGIEKFKTSANTPYGFHASVKKLRENFPSMSSRDDITFVPVTSVADLEKGYSVFSELQPKLTKEQYISGFNIGAGKLKVIHAIPKDAPDKVIGMMAGAYRANLLGMEFDPDTIVVGADSRGKGIGKDLLATAAYLCIDKECGIFVESGKARGVSDFYEAKGIPSDSVNYRWDLPVLIDVMSADTKAWVDATIHKLGI